MKCYVIAYTCQDKISDNEIFKCSGSNAESGSTTCGLYYHMGRVSFIFTVVICKEILVYTKSLTV